MLAEGRAASVEVPVVILQVFCGEGCLTISFLQNFAKNPNFSPKYTTNQKNEKMHPDAPHLSEKGASRGLNGAQGSPKYKQMRQRTKNENY